MYGCSEPPLLDLLTPRFSPAQRILQYLRSLTVSDPHDRFFLVHTLAGCSRQEFVRSHPLSRQFRSGVMAMSAWMYWRCEKYHHTPYILAKLSDSRITEKERLRTAILVFSTNPCCLDPPLSRKFMRRISKPRDLLEPRNLRLCRAMKSVPCTQATLRRSMQEINHRTTLTQGGPLWWLDSCCRKGE